MHADAGGVLGLEALEEELLIDLRARRRGALDELGGAVAHVALDDGERLHGLAELGESGVERGGDVGGRIDERAVEIEKDELGEHRALRSE